MPKPITAHVRIIMVQHIFSCFLLFVFEVGLLFAGITERTDPAPSSFNTNQVPTSRSHSLPESITSAEGKTYNAVKLLRVEPDGLVIEYRPDCGGTGLAKLKFAFLSESLRKDYGYDEAGSAAYERAEERVAVECTRKLREEGQTRIAVQNAVQRVETVFVDVAEPVVEYDYYDPFGPKPAAIHEGFSGNTRPRHSCSIKTDDRLVFDWKREKENSPFRFFFKVVPVSTELSIKITLPNNPYESLRAHEEGHRNINEHFYETAGRAARHAANSILDKEFSCSADNFEVAKNLAVAQASLAIRTEYLRYVSDPATNANKYYDELTDHGRKMIDPKKAVREAVEQFKLEVPN